MSKHPSLALLFDLDGTLVDTDPLHIQAFNQMLSRWKRSIDLEYYKSYVMGFPMDMIFSRLLPEASTSEYEGLSDEKERLFRDLLGELAPTPGAVRLLDYARSHGIGTALVTNAPRENAIRILGGLGLIERFDVIVITDELANAKPHPLPYLTAVDKLETAAENAIAFEDSLAGVKSASDSGVYPIGLLSSLQESRLKAAGAHDVIRDFNDEKLWSRLATWTSVRV